MLQASYRDLQGSSSCSIVLSASVYRSSNENKICIRQLMRNGNYLHPKRSHCDEIVIADLAAAFYKNRSKQLVYQM